MSARRHIFLLLAFLALVSVTCMSGLAAQQPASAPLPQPSQLAVDVPSGGGALATPTVVFAFVLVDEPPQPAIPEKRRLTLEFPPQIRVGDSDILRLTFEVDDLGNLTPTAQVEGNLVTGQTVAIPNLYETHNVIAEARLDLAGVEVRPPDVVSETLLPGESATFFWSVHAQEAGRYRGTVWLHLRFVNKVSGEESRKTVSAQVVEVEAVNFFGMSANLARGTGAVGSLIGAVLGFPFIDDILKFLFRRRRK